MRNIQDKKGYLNLASGPQEGFGEFSYYIYWSGPYEYGLKSELQKAVNSTRKTLLLAVQA
jgi:hypothetical protein